MTSTDAEKSADNRLKAPSSVPIWVYASVVLTALLSLYSLSLRYRVEAKNKMVGITTDWDTIQSLAAGSGISPQEATKRLKVAGLRGIVIGETSYGEVLLDAITQPGPRHEMQDRFTRGFRLRFPNARPDSAPPALVRSVSIGLDQTGLAVAKKEGLFIVARLSNPMGVGESYVRGMVDWIHEDGATFFLPQGEQVLGRRLSIGALQEQLKVKNIGYCSPEFAKIGGDQNMVEDAVKGLTLIRLHSAQSQELDKLTTGGAIERYTKAVSERNQRMILVRPLSMSAPDPIGSFGELIMGISKEIAKENYELGPPHGFSESGASRPIFILIALAMGPALFWLASQFITSKTLRIAGAAALLLLALACVKDQGRQIAALTAATLFPVLAFVMLDVWTKSKRNVFLLFLGVSAVSLVGGLVVGGLLNGLAFFVRADVFSGVKLAHFLPMGLIGLYFFARFVSAKDSMRSPVVWGQTILALLLMVAFGFMASRTGNDNPAGVSGVELAFRSLLEQFLVVRPRTKEFLIGHPLMVVALGLLVRHKTLGQNKGGWIALLLMVGAIGQTSMVNTMCHLHTPLTVSLTRIGVGWMMGGIIGAILWVAVRRLPARAVN